MTEPTQSNFFDPARLVAVLIVLGGALFAIERAYSGRGLLDPLVLFSIGSVLLAGVYLMWPSGDDSEDASDRSEID